jgi:hypothetical protein
MFRHTIIYFYAAASILHDMPPQRQFQSMLAAHHLIRSTYVTRAWKVCWIMLSFRTTSMTYMSASCNGDRRFFVFFSNDTPCCHATPVLIYGGMQWL